MANSMPLDYSLHSNQSFYRNLKVRKIRHMRSKTYNQKPRPIYTHHQKTPTLLKTELCRYWSYNQKCPYGKQCSFAHGPSELRERDR